jgi:hypothetical protein
LVLTQSILDALQADSCEGDRVEPEPETSVLMLVVDVSASMMDVAAATDGRSKWEVTKEALALTLDALPPSMAVGMLLYPIQMTEPNEIAPTDVSACVAVDQLVSIDLLGGVSSAQRSVLANGLEGALVEGGTPTHDAYAYALEHLVSFASDLLRSDQPDCSVGWQYSAEANQLVLCEESCRRLKRDPGGELELLFGCMQLPAIAD